MRRSKRRRKPLGEDDVLRAVVCDYVGPAECAINAEAGYTTAVASRAGLVARHTGPQRECAALPLPAAPNFFFFSFFFGNVCAVLACQEVFGLMGQKNQRKERASHTRRACPNNHEIFFPQNDQSIAMLPEESNKMKHVLSSPVRIITISEESRAFSVENK